MENKNKPAYPAYDPWGKPTDGLTKLEVFAMAAMQGICSNLKHIDETYKNQNQAEVIASKSLRIAEETLKSLNPSTPTPTSNAAPSVIEHLKFLKGEIMQGVQPDGLVAKGLCDGIDELLKQLEPPQHGKD